MKYRYLFIIILLFGCLLRFWQLGVNPSSLDWDEVSLGYNAYSLLKTGRDEYGTFLPLSIRSFNDYKPPLYSYITTIPVAVFGLNEFSTRFTSASLGSLTLIIVYLLVQELFPGKKRLQLLSVFFLAVSPWHIQFSRVAFEANTALFFFIAGSWLFIKGLKSGICFLPAFLSFGFSLYAYHSPRLVAPVFLLVLSLIFIKKILRQWPYYLVSGIFLLIFLFPLIQDLRTSTSARFGSVTVINQNTQLGDSLSFVKEDSQNGDIIGKLLHNRRIVYTKEILAGYLDHFNFDYLFLTGDSPGRHHAVGMGMLYVWDGIFILFGAFYIIRREKYAGIILGVWFLTAPLAAALTVGTPHAVRSLLYLPTYQIFIAVGFLWFVEKSRRLDKRYYFGSGVIVITFFLFLVNFFYYLNMYYVHSPLEYSQWWQYGYKEAVAEADKMGANYSKIVVTYEYDQPYVYFLFYEKLDPAWYQANWGGREIIRDARVFGKYEFRKIDWARDSMLTNTLFIGSPKEIPANAPGLIKNIKFLDGTVAFRIVGK